MNKEERARRGAAAAQLLDNQIFQDAWESVGGLIVKTLGETPLDGTPETEAYVMELVRRLQTLKGVKTQIEQYVNAGKLTIVEDRPDVE